MLVFFPVNVAVQFDEDEDVVSFISMPLALTKTPSLLSSHATINFIIPYSSDYDSAAVINKTYLNYLIQVKSIIYSYKFK